MLEQNPQFNKRKDWTSDQWDQWKLGVKNEERAKLSTVSGFGSSVVKNRSDNIGKASVVWTKRANAKARKARVGFKF